ncbi:hypothetical protein BDZ88DRAFT_435298 [Geranomyces variabilis]|nr:hypothetical protein BDZ88DRAFT_435298 [Geranomyces variabilis]KAJ3131695.1 hypothetical protein HDU90_008147 [Geranomyces variabilis]
MHASTLASFGILSALATTVIAQSAPYLDGTWHVTTPTLIECGPDITVDNFTNPHREVLPLVGEVKPRDVNLLGGDYGWTDTAPAPPAVAVNITTAGASVTILDASKAFFFFKLDAGACYDLTNVNSLVFDLVAPVGGSFDMGLTQKSADCHQRVGGESGSSDSKYVPLTRYITPNGQKQTVVLPLQDLKGTFDFAHLKDITFINWKSSAPFIFSNIRLRRACRSNGPTGTNSTISAGTTIDDAVNAPLAVPSPVAGTGAAPATSSSTSTTTTAIPAPGVNTASAAQQTRIAAGLTLAAGIASFVCLF